MDAGIKCNPPEDINSTWTLSPDGMLLQINIQNGAFHIVGFDGSMLRLTDTIIQNGTKVAYFMYLKKK